MMITNGYLIECLLKSIGRHNENLRINNKNYSNDAELPYLSDFYSNNVPDDILKSLKTLTISISPDILNSDEFQDQLSQVLNVMKLNEIIIEIDDRYDTKSISLLSQINSDINNIIIQLNSDIKEISISGKYGNLELLGITPNYFKKFTNLNRLEVDSPDILDKTKVLMNAINLREITLEQYIEYKERINFDSISGLKITGIEEFDLENSNMEEIIDILNETSGITLKMRPESLSKLDPEGTLRIPIEIFMSNAAQLDLNDLSKYKSIFKVRVITGRDKNNMTREEYEKVRGEIDKIISQIEFPEENDPDREKKIFAQIYKILGKKIDYNYKYDIGMERHMKKKLIEARNEHHVGDLIGGLINNTCVCAGYANILENVAACFGIKAVYVTGEKDRNKEEAHAWNAVLLDNQWYWVDLTWDANNIKNDNYPLRYFLKSTKDFHHDRFMLDGNEYIDLCTRSISEEEQVKLLTGRAESRSLEEIQEAKNIGYLGSVVSDIAGTGLTASSIIKTGEEFNKVQTNQRENVNATSNRAISGLATSYEIAEINELNIESSVQTIEESYQQKDERENPNIDGLGEHK